MITALNSNMMIVGEDSDSTDDSYEDHEAIDERTNTHTITRRCED